MRADKALLLLMLVAPGFAGCNPSSFNSILDKAPVQMFGLPGASTSTLTVLPLLPPTESGTTSAARMLVANRDTSYVGVADFDMNGKVTLTEATSAEANIGGSVYSAAARPDGPIALGVPRYNPTGADPPGGLTSILSLTGTPAGGYTFSVLNGAQGGGNTSRVGIAMASGNVTASLANNFVVVGDNTVQVLGADGKPIAATPLPSACPTIDLSSPTDHYAFRSVAVGDLLAGGFDEIVLGGKGKVWFVQYDPATNSLPCPTKSLSLGASATFGSSLVVADFDGDGNKDLAVGVPGDRVVVYFGPLDLSDPTKLPSPSVTITNSLGATGFGQRMASYQVSGTIMAQLLVADQGATAAGRAGAGRVLRFTVARAPVTLFDTSSDIALFDSNQDAEMGVFAGSLGGLMFNTGLCVPGGGVQLVPWATNNNDVLTFFNYPVPPPATVTDPRCFALKP